MIVALVLNIAVSVNIDRPIGEIFFKYVLSYSHHALNKWIFVLCIVAGLLPWSLQWYVLLCPMHLSLKMVLITNTQGSHLILNLRIYCSKSGVGDTTLGTMLPEFVVCTSAKETTNTENSDDSWSCTKYIVWVLCCKSPMSSQVLFRIESNRVSRRWPVTHRNDGKIIYFSFPILIEIRNT